MFTTIHQFSTLAEHTHIDGLEEMIQNFFKITDDFKRKPYDLLVGTSTPNSPPMHP
jgi:dynein heavy chain